MQNPMIDPILGLDIFSPYVTLMKLFFAITAGFIVGFERSLHNQPAGLRTHMVLALGSCGIMVLSLLLPIKFASFSPNGDPGRMAAQVISGIGFLGAGAIFRFGFNIKGLTTAASIWTISGIGLVFGAGFYFLGGVMTLMLLFILQAVDKLEHVILTKEDPRLISIIFDSGDVKMKNVTKILEKFITIKRVSVVENVKKKEIKIDVHCKIAGDQNLREIFESLKKLGGIKTIQVD